MPGLLIWYLGIPDINCSLLSSGINMKLLVLISILYSIADTECTVSIKRSLFDHKHIYFLTLSTIVLILCQPAGHDTVYYTYIHQCNNPLTVFLSNANIHKAIKYKAKARAFKAEALSISRCRLWVFCTENMISVICIR